MDYVQRMNVLHSRNDLLKELACLLLWYPCLLYDIVEEFTPARKLHNQVQLARCFNYLVQLDDVRMANQFQNVDLPSDSLHVCDVRDATFFKYLDGHVFLSELMHTFAHLAKGALTNLLFDVVVPHDSSLLFDNILFVQCRIWLMRRSVPRQFVLLADLGALRHDSFAFYGLV